MAPIIVTSYDATECDYDEASRDLNMQDAAPDEVEAIFATRRRYWMERLNLEPDELKRMQIVRHANLHDAVMGHLRLLQTTEAHPALRMPRVRGGDWKKITIKLRTASAPMQETIYVHSLNHFRCLNTDGNEILYPPRSCVYGGFYYDHYKTSTLEFMRDIRDDEMLGRGYAPGDVLEVEELAANDVDLATNGDEAVLASYDAEFIVGRKPPLPDEPWGFKDWTGCYVPASWMIADDAARPLRDLYVKVTFRENLLAAWRWRLVRAALCFANLHLYARR